MTLLNQQKPPFLLLCYLDCMNRKRWLYLLLLLLTIPLGLYSRSESPVFAPLFGKYGGDVLYATAAFFFLRLLLIRTRLATVGLFALLACFAVEFLQLYEGEWMVNIRNSMAGGLLLGHGFLWTDLVCYTTGVVLGLGAGYVLEQRPMFSGAPVAK
jgi:hypothetical protein